MKFLFYSGGFENKENEKSDTRELLATNRALSLSIDSLEQRCKLVEIKNKKMKQYKQIVKCSSVFRCSKCAEFFLPHIFFDHLPTCMNYNYNNFTPPTQSLYSKDKDSSSNNFSSKIYEKIEETGKFVNNAKIGSFPRMNENIKSQVLMKSSNEIEIKPHEKLTDIFKNNLKLSIRQTNIQNGEDNKPYTEYTIFCSLKRVKWRITKKYSNFCQLHQELSIIFPNLNLKNSGYIVSNVSNFGHMLDLKKPLFLEEKRKGLENYLMEIVSNEILKNSEPFKRFLLIEEAFKRFSEPEEKEIINDKYKFSTPVPKSTDKIQEKKNSFISEKKNIDFSLIEKENEGMTTSKQEKIMIAHNDLEESFSDSRKSSVFIYFGFFYIYIEIIF